MANQRFLDIRTHGFLRVAAVIPKVHLGYPLANANEHVARLEEAYAKGVQYAVCTELGLTGYSCGDLFFDHTLLSGAKDALMAVVHASRAWKGMMVSVGVPLAQDGKLFNCAVTMLGGKVLAIAPKTHLPNYGEFYEERWFTSAMEAQCDTFRLSFGNVVPFGNDLLIRWDAHEGCVIHTEVCEDIWMPGPPSMFAALSGATVLANLSASNITIGKSIYREQLVLGSSGDNIAVQIYTAAGEGESTTDVSWDGDAFIGERGGLLARSERFAQGGTMIVSDVSLRSIDHDRMRQGTFHKNATFVLAGRRPLRTVEVGAVGLTDRREPKVWERFERKLDPHPFVPSDPAARDERCRETFMIQATALVQRLRSLPTKDPKITVGVSGGQDSTHALLLAAHAMDLMGLPRTNIVGVTMPGFGTTDRTYNNAVALVKAVGATFREIPIRDLSSATFDAVGYDPKQRGIAYENIQAWMRKHVLFSVSATGGGIVLGTGDLSELALGWCTYGGDHLSHYGVNGGVPKTLISFLIRWTADVIYKDDAAVQAVLTDILATPISPELLPPDEQGNIVQKTEDKNGPYELHDFFIYWFVRFGYAPSAIARCAYQAFDGKYDIGTIRKWLLVFVKRFFANQFKRSVAPDGPKVGLVAFSPRGDWRMPSDMLPNAWVEEVETNVPETFPV